MEGALVCPPSLPLCVHQTVARNYLKGKICRSSCSGLFGIFRPLHLYPSMVFFSCLCFLVGLCVSDKHTIQKLCSVCSADNRGEGTISPGLEAMLFSNSPTQVLYNVEVSPGGASRPQVGILDRNCFLESRVLWLFTNSMSCWFSFWDGWHVAFSCLNLAPSLVWAESLRQLIWYCYGGFWYTLWACAWWCVFNLDTTVRSCGLCTQLPRLG